MHDTNTPAIVDIIDIDIIDIIDIGSFQKDAEHFIHLPSPGEAIIYRRLCVNNDF